MEQRPTAVNNPVNPVKEPKKDEKETITHKVGDAIERVGEKLQDMGATKAGQAVYKAGNKLEHSQDDKKH